MSLIRLKNCIFLLFLLTLSANIYSQHQTELMISTIEILPQNITQIFTDSRDSTRYPLIASSDRYWLNANLNFKTEDSNCLDDLESNCNTLGRLYSWEEAQNVCPENWKLPTQEDFRKLFIHISSEEEGYQTAIFTFPYTFENFNKKNPAGIQINPNGMKHKKKYIANTSFNLWLRSTNEYDASHIHGYEYKIKKEKKSLLTIFPHNHEEKKSIRYKRKFGVRCVIPISEFNKLSFDNG